MVTTVFVINKKTTIDCTLTVQSREFSIEYHNHYQRVKHNDKLRDCSYIQCIGMRYRPSRSKVSQPLMHRGGLSSQRDEHVTAVCLKITTSFVSTKEATILGMILSASDTDWSNALARIVGTYYSVWRQTQANSIKFEVNYILI